MKRFTLLLALVAMTISMWAATTFSVGDLNYTVLDESARTAECTGLTDEAKEKTNLSVTIPATVTNSGTTYTVESVGEKAFENCKNIISASVTASKVQSRAFAYCSSLASVTLCEGVTYIGSTVFTNCKKITTINFPASVIGIEGALIYQTVYDVDQFTDCSSLKEITVDSNNSRYASYNGMLYSKDYAKLYLCPQGYVASSSDIIHPSCEIIWNRCFADNPTITMISIPYGVSEIKFSAFRACKNLKLVEIPSTITTIGNIAFSALPALEDFYINSISPITIDKSSSYYIFDESATPRLFVPRNKQEDYKAAGWTDFASYNEDDVVAADYHSDQNVSYTVTSTEPVTVNGTKYDGMCKAVRGRVHADVSGETNIPASIELLGGKQYAVTKIDTLAFSTSNSFSITGCANVDTVNASAFYEQTLTSIELPSVKHIGYRAFYRTPITSIDLPQGLKFIDNRAFESAGLTSIKIPDGTRMSLRPFYKCSKIVTAEVGENIDYLPYYCFEQCNGLKGVVLGSSMKMISDGVFYKAPVTSLVVKATNPPVAESTKPWNSFTKANCTLYVPKGSKAAYQATEMWSGFKDYVEINVATSVTGDINGDGIVDITDVNMVINMVLGKLEKTSAADVDGSGDVDITDVNTVINIMLGKN